MSKPKLWTKDFIIVSTINFFLTIVFYLLIVIMGVYAVNEFNASISQAGLVTGIFIIGTINSTLYTILGFVVLASTMLYFLLHGKKEKASINSLAQ